MFSCICPQSYCKIGKKGNNHTPYFPALIFINNIRCRLRRQGAGTPAGAPRKVSLHGAEGKLTPHESLPYAAPKTVFRSQEDRLRAAGPAYTKKRPGNRSGKAAGFPVVIVIYEKESWLLAYVGEDAAVNVKDVAVDEVGSVGSEEHGRAHQVFGRAPARRRGL